MVQVKARDIVYDAPYFYDTTYSVLSFFSIISKIFLVFFIIAVLYVDFTSSYRELFLRVLFFVKLIVGALLVYRFTSRRTRKIVFTELDRKIAYSAGIFIIVVSTSDIILKYSEAVHAWAYPFTSAFVDTLLGSHSPSKSTSPTVPLPTPSQVS